jgi:glutathione S-transferase
LTNIQANWCTIPALGYIVQHSAISQYQKEVRLALGVLNTVLERKQPVGDTVTIADLSFVPCSGARKDEGPED